MSDDDAFIDGVIKSVEAIVHIDSVITAYKKQYLKRALLAIKTRIDNACLKKRTRLKSTYQRGVEKLQGLHEFFNTDQTTRGKDAENVRRLLDKTATARFIETSGGGKLFIGESIDRGEKIALETAISRLADRAEKCGDFKPVWETVENCLNRAAAPVFIVQIEDNHENGARLHELEMINWNWIKYEENHQKSIGLIVFGDGALAGGAERSDLLPAMLLNELGELAWRLRHEKDASDFRFDNRRFQAASATVSERIYRETPNAPLSLHSLLYTYKRRKKFYTNLEHPVYHGKYEGSVERIVRNVVRCASRGEYEDLESLDNASKNLPG